MSTKRDRKGKKQPARVVGFLGVGLDNKDGEQRLTRSEHFFLVGGSPETHAQLQDTAIKFTEALKRRGTALPEVSLEEIVDLFHEAQD